MCKQIAISLITLLLSANATADPPAALDATLCNFPVEGLTLDSSKAQVDAMFRPLGWHDQSVVRGPGVSHSQAVEEEWTWRRLPPETAEESRKRTMANIPRLDSSLTLARLGGRPFALTLGQSYSGESDVASRSGKPGLLRRAEELCAMADPRFRLRGCQRIKPGSNLVEVVLEPVTPGSGNCTVRLGGAEGKGLSFGVSRNDRSLAPKPVTR